MALPPKILPRSGWPFHAERDRQIHHPDAARRDPFREMMTEGIKQHVIQGVSVPVYGVAKTVADCFRFRNRIGVNIAVEALRDAWQGKKATSEELWHYAKVCRVLNVMRPYFDSLA